MPSSPSAAGAELPQATMAERGAQAVRFVANLPVLLLAFVWRRLLLRTTIIGVAGSAGKTTTKNLLAAALGLHHPTIWTQGNDNGRFGLPRTLLRIRPWHRFAVVEIGVRGIGHMRRSALLARPDVVVMLGVGSNHSQELGSLDRKAWEKGALVRSLKRGGVAVLNADDRRVRGMQPPPGRRTVFYGTSPDSEVWGESVGAGWPERLACTIHVGERRVGVQTRFVGDHWLRSVVAAAAVVDVCGVALDDLSEAASKVQPFEARMQPVELRSGGTVWRDEYNGSVESFRPALRALAAATAKRKILVAGGCLDTGEDDEDGVRFLAEQGAEAADLLVFVGPRGRDLMDEALSRGVDRTRVRAYERLEDAAGFLRAAVGAGDLVLLKSFHSLHLSRLYFALESDVSCWKPLCTKMGVCDHCDELGAKIAAATMSS